MRKLMIAAALSACVAGQLLLVSGAANASSGGGCSPNSGVGSGWSFSSCISAHNNTVLPDGYVGTRGTQGSGCVIHVDLIKNGVLISSRPNSCNLTHVVGNSATGGGQFFTGVWASWNGGETAEVISPIENN